MIVDCVKKTEINGVVYNEVWVTEKKIFGCKQTIYRKFNNEIAVVSCKDIKFLSGFEYQRINVLFNFLGC